jgi:DNA invertase Pin-like site-specific DNA recombinase
MGNVVPRLPMSEAPLAKERPVALHILFGSNGGNLVGGSSKADDVALDTFRALGLEFVSLSEALDTATPAGRMTFTVLGAVAELERSLIAERVKAGIRNARARGVRLGRPKVIADVATTGRLRAQGPLVALK